MAQAVSRLPLTTEDRVHVTFVVNRVALRLFFFQVRRFYPVSIIPP